MNLESGYLTAMRAEYQRLTGALPGEDSDIGIRMALLANQLELLEEELGALRQAADPETAEGEMLDRHADSRGLRRKEAAAAGGVLRFYREGAAAQEIVLPQGLVASTAGAEPVRFVTTAEGRIAAGETEALVPAQAEQPGSTGNAAAGSITVLVTGWRTPRASRADRTPKLTTNCAAVCWRATMRYPMAPMPPTTAVWPWPRTGWRRCR